MKPARAPARPSQARSLATRERILAAARALFASEGYERTTVRAIASAAGADPALVIRYFGSKENLFAAAARFELRLPDLAAIPRREIGAALVAHFLDRWEGDPADKALQILLRAAVTNDGAAQRMRDIFARQLLPAVSLMVPKAQVRMRAALVASQVLGLALCRYILKLPAVVALGRDDIVAWYGPTIQRYLVAASPDHGPGSE